MRGNVVSTVVRKCKRGRPKAFVVRKQLIRGPYILLIEGRSEMAVDVNVVRRQDHKEQS